jgi:hypothetical protein
MAGFGDAPTVEMAAVVALERADESDRSLATGRLGLLGAVLGDWGLRGFVMRVTGWPVLFITHPVAPWAVSVGPVNFWRGDPVRHLAPCDRVLDAAWIVADQLGCWP